jgi:hypothetical protein
MFAASQAALYYTIKYMLKHLEGMGDADKQKHLEKGNKVLERLGLKDADLDEYERKSMQMYSGWTAEAKYHDKYRYNCRGNHSS